MCPITSNTRPYPFKVLLPEGLPIGGAVLADQVQSIDRVGRQRLLMLADSANRTAMTLRSKGTQPF